MKQSIRMMIWGALALVSSVCTAWAEYKPVDVSDIKGDQRKQLMAIVKEVKSMPTLVRDSYFCDQLGLYFTKDGSEAMTQRYGWPHICSTAVYFGSRGGRLTSYSDARPPAVVDLWLRCYHDTHKFNPGVVLSFFTKDISIVVRANAKYLLQAMPDVTRYAMLASIGRMLYKVDGTTLPASGYGAKVRIGSGFDVGYNGNENDGYSFMDPAGRECSLKDAFAADPKKKRWRDTVRRCENLVGERDILALFPDEVKAMRKHYRKKLAQMKEQKNEANKALLAAADEMLASLPNEDLKYAKLAAAVGLYFQDHQTAGYDGSSLGSSVVIFLPDGETITGDDVRNNANPGIMQQIPHEAILERYKEPIQQMARHIAADRFSQMPPLLREAFRALWSGDLVTADGKPAKMGDETIYVETFDRKWFVPWESMDRQNAYFMSSTGKKIPYWSVYSGYWDEWVQTIRLAHLCAHILGRKAILEYVPPAKVGETTDAFTAAPRETAMGSTSPGGAGSSKDVQYAEGIAALRRMSAALRRAWLAENMGFCYTQSDAPAYTAPHIANDNALFVGEQGKERKLSEVATDKMTPDWVAATKAALAVGHEQVAAPFKEELKALAVQTATHILKSIDKTPRYSWLAEMNHLIFNPNGQSAYPPGGQTNSVESGFKVHAPDVNYGGKLYYNPQGKISQPSASNAGWKRWNMLFRCADVAGIEAINAEFKEDVEAMRAAYKKSPFYKK